MPQPTPQVPSRKIDCENHYRDDHKSRPPDRIPHVGKIFYSEFSKEKFLHNTGLAGYIYLCTMSWYRFSGTCEKKRTALSTAGLTRSAYVSWVKWRGEFLTSATQC